MHNPDIVIIEGINVLQADQHESLYPSDFFDFSVYMDANEADIKNWYLERFFMLRETAFKTKARISTHIRKSVKKKQKHLR